MSETTTRSDALDGRLRVLRRVEDARVACLNSGTVTFGTIAPEKEEEMVAPISNEKTRVDQWIDALKNHRILSVVIFAGIVLAALAGFSESVRTLLNLGSRSEEQRVIVMTEYASTLLKSVVSARNSEAWVHIENIPESVPAALYREALMRELRKIVPDIKFMNAESMESQLDFMMSATFDEPSDVWGTVLVLVDVAKDSMLIIQRPDKSHQIDRVFVGSP